MANRINPGHALPINGFKVESTPEIKTVEELQDQLANVIRHGERIILEATDEIAKRNACLQEGVRVMGLCRKALQNDSANFDILDQIDRWMGPAPIEEKE